RDIQLLAFLKIYTEAVMPNFCTVALVAIVVSTTAAMASANSREACASIVSHLGYPVDDYRFEESGIFSMEQHHFGTLTCYINIANEFDSLYRGDSPIAEDGYFGTEVLAERDRLITEFETSVAAAKEIRRAAIEAARSEFRRTEEARTQERDTVLESLRVSSEPSFAGQDTTVTENLEAAEEQPSVADMDNPDIVEGTPQVPSPLREDGSSNEASRMYVVADRLTRRTCPSTACGTVGTLMLREAVEVLEERQGWARTTRPYDASCVNDISEYVDNGNARCDATNGIVDGMFAEWVSLNFLENERPEDPADTASAEEELVAQSDDFRTFRAEFAEAARDLIKQGRCSESDFAEMGGWLSSPSRGDGVYFTYCGGLHVDNRLYLDVRTGEVFQ
ncbi:hypothetical protein LCGC14_2472970, partial [marine sediment metagenome]